MLLWNNWQEEWLLYHKVTFDGLNKLIIVNPSISTVDVREDIYTAWVDWLTLEDHTKWPPALRITGGDPTVQGQSTGLVFFTINGWRIFIDHGVTLVGSIFSDDFDSPLVTTTDTFVVTSVVSSLVTQAASSAAISGSFPTAAEIAQAVWSNPSATALSGNIAQQVWNTDMTSYNNANTFGYYVKKKLLSVAKYIGLG